MNLELKNKVIFELERADFPNLSFLYSNEVLEITEKLLNDFLEEDKKLFKERLNVENKNITFETFETFDSESKMSFLWSLLHHINNVRSSDKTREIIENFEGKISEYSNEISYSKRYFEMFEYCLNNCNLNIEQEKIISDTVKAYKVRGIALDEKKQNKLKKINLELSELSTKFSNNVLDAEKEFEYILENDKFLKELPESDLENAKNLYSEKFKNKKSTEGFSPLGYAFDSSASSYIAILKYCSNPEIRKHFAESHSKFASEGKYDNREIVLKIINLKDKKAKILGYKNYAELALEFKMAKSPEQIIDLLTDLSIKAKPKAEKEIEEIKEYFGLEKIESSDVTYYSRILKEKKYSFDDKKLKEYFEFNSVQKKLFETVEKLYGITMEPLSQPFPLKEKGVLDNIEIYKVYKNGKFISYFMGDYFYNPNKRSGAWADEIRERYKSKKSIVINNMSIVKSKSGPTLLRLGEVTTLFHEFGHAIHSMLSKSEYSELTGFGVEHDFVELPSQIMEKWASDESTIKNIASHYKTGKTIDNELFSAMKKLKYFGSGQFILGQNVYGIIDMMFHSGKKFETKQDLDKNFLEKVNEISLFKKDENYKMYCSFSHIFAGGYSAGYYGYRWADIIVEDIWAEFKKNGVYDKETAQKFEEKILAAGSIKKASEMFKEFMGREVSIEAFLKENGI